MPLNIFSFLELQKLLLVLCIVPFCNVETMEYYVTKMYRLLNKTFTSTRTKQRLESIKMVKKPVWHSDLLT